MVILLLLHYGHHVQLALLVVGQRVVEQHGAQVHDEQGPDGGAEDDGEDGDGDNLLTPGQDLRGHPFMAGSGQEYRS